jgi:hypothetical protein
VRAILDGRLAARHDPRWAASGAADPVEYEFWSWRCCGMACLRSMLLARSGTAPGTVTLARETLDAGGYRLRREPEGVDGLFYAPFVDYVAHRWGITATVEGHLPVEELWARVDAGAWVMASVHPGIRRPHQAPPSQGGHLVLVHGVRAGPQLVFHNPSGDTAATQADVALPLGDFARFFAGRGVALPAATPSPGRTSTLE